MSKVLSQNEVDALRDMVQSDASAAAALAETGTKPPEIEGRGYNVESAENVYVFDFKRPVYEALVEIFRPHIA